MPALQNQQGFERWKLILLCCQTSLIVSSFALVSPLSSSVAAPALNRIGEDLHIPIGLDLQMVLSIFLLSYAFGPFFMSSFSETWGRAGVLRYGNLVFFLFTLFCGFATSETQIKIFRFLAGIGGSASIGVRHMSTRIHMTRALS